MFVLIPDWQPNINRIPSDNLMSLAKMLYGNDQEIELAFLVHNNQGQYFKNENQILSLPSWDATDEILGIKSRSGMPVSLSDLDFEPNDELIYYDDVIEVYQDDQIRMHVRVNSNTGSITQTETLLPDDLEEVVIFDDRGFVIQKQLLNGEGQILGQVWFDDFNHEILQQRKDGLIEVLEYRKSKFDQETYRNFDEIVVEFVAKHFAKTVDATFIAQSGLQTEKLVSGMQDKFDINYLVSTTAAQNNKIKNIYATNGKLLVPNSFTKEILLNNYGTELDSKIVEGYVYPTTLKLGISAEEELQTILWSVDEFDNVKMQTVFSSIEVWMQQNPDTAVTVINLDWAKAYVIAEAIVRFLKRNFTELESIAPKLISDVVFDREKLKDLTKEILDKGFDFVPETDEEKQEINNRMDEIVDGVLRFKLQMENDPETIAKEFDTARVFVDLNLPPSDYLQVAAISAGVPQIVRFQTSYVDDGKNGMILKSDDEIIAGFKYFLDGLNNWNEALVKNVGLIGKFSSDSLVNFWKGI